ARLLRQTTADTLGELGMCVQPGSDCGTAEWNLSEPLERRADAVIALAYLCRVAPEFLTERDRHRVHQMRAAGLDDVVELGALRLQRVGETLHRRQEVVRDLVECRQMHGGRKDVVRR